MQKKPNIKLIIGLGNPGKKYENTYHNIGHIFADVILSASEESFGKVTVLKSNVFMNESGRFVREEMKKLNLKPENLLIVHDDSDIELGQTKLDFDRGSAGHKGVQNIVDQLKTKDFWRLRIGIRPPIITSKIFGIIRRPALRKKAEEFVLKKISSTNQKVFEKIFAKIASSFST